MTMILGYALAGLIALAGLASAAVAVFLLVSIVRGALRGDYKFKPLASTPVPVRVDSSGTRRDWSNRLSVADRWAKAQVERPDRLELNVSRKTWSHLYH